MTLFHDHVIVKIFNLDNKQQLTVSSSVKNIFPQVLTQLAVWHSCIFSFTITQHNKSNMFIKDTAILVSCPYKTTTISSSATRRVPTEGLGIHTF